MDQDALDQDIRLFISTTEEKAGIALQLMSDAFDEEGYAVATMEMDERRDIWEASLYLHSSEEAMMRARLAEMLEAGLPGMEIRCEPIPDIDWIAKSLEGLSPVRAGRFVVHGSHDRDKVRIGDVAIEIDAGMAFGTGHHGTTAGCLELIEDVFRTRTIRDVLDLGTGSGVLAIAARKIRPVLVLATDIDPVATKVAAANVRLNGIASGIVTATAAGFHSPAFRQHGPFDLIIANILARPLMRMAPDVGRHLSPGGSIILSGILASQRWKVLAAYNGQRFRHLRTLWRNGWVTMHLEK